MIEQAIRQAFETGSLTQRADLLLAFQHALGQAMLDFRQEREDEDTGDWDRVSGWSCARKKAAVKHRVPASPWTLEAMKKIFAGHMAEAWVATLAIAGGAPIRETLGEQRTLVTALGTGHPDGRIGPVDPATALWENKGRSSYAMKLLKKTQALHELSDEFGERTQIIAYAHAAAEQGLIEPPGAIVFTGVSRAEEFGHLNVFDIEERTFVLDDAALSLLESRKRERALVAESDSPWELPTLDTKRDKGHEVLPVACEYCPYRRECWRAAGVSLIKSGKRFRVMRGGN